MIDLKSLKSFDWRSLKKYTSPKAAADLNHFLEHLPQNTDKTLLIVAGVSWGVAGALILFTTMQLQQFTELRAKLQEADALKPIVPLIKDVAVDAQEVNQFVDKTKNIYSGLSINASGSSIVIASDNTANFGQFREAVGHVQNGGSGWRVNIDRLCVGRECTKQPLAASLKINKVSVETPGGKN
ncbi:MAG: hypothetical protein ACT4OY_00685 [Alphaproteobacteria bacterium]